MVVSTELLIQSACKYIMVTYLVYCKYSMQSTVQNSMVLIQSDCNLSMLVSTVLIHKFTGRGSQFIVI